MVKASMTDCMDLSDSNSPSTLELAAVSWKRDKFRTCSQDSEATACTCFHEIAPVALSN